jgi:O-antigen/teichoic acid export membrane protein
MVFYADGALFAWSGDAKLARVAGPILAALALGNVLNGLMHVPYQLQLAHGWTSFAIKLNVVAVVLLVPAILWVVPRYGAVGAASVWIALNAGYLLAGIPLMYRRLLPAEMWRWYIRDVCQPTLGALSGLVLAMAFRPNAYSDRQGWLVFLAVALLLAILGAGATLGDLRRHAAGALRRGITP